MYRVSDSGFKDRCCLSGCYPLAEPISPGIKECGVFAADKTSFHCLTAKEKRHRYRDEECDSSSSPSVMPIANLKAANQQSKCTLREMRPS
eukprot:s880_g9.t1